MYIAKLNEDHVNDQNNCTLKCCHKTTNKIIEKKMQFLLNNKILRLIHCFFLLTSTNCFF